MVNFFAPKITRQNSLSVHIQRLYSTPTEVTIARLAQSVEHETLNLRVVGSSPTLGVQLFALYGNNRTNRTEIPRVPTISYLSVFKILGHHPRGEPRGEEPRGGNLAGGNLAGGTSRENLAGNFLLSKVKFKAKFYNDLIFFRRFN